MSAKLSIATYNKFGDIICPECSANIITPPSKRVVSGVGECPYCQGEFIVKGDKKEVDSI